MLFGSPCPSLSRRPLSCPLWSPSCRTLKSLYLPWWRKTLARSSMASRSTSLGRSTSIRRSASLQNSFLRGFKLSSDHLMSYSCNPHREISTALKRGGCFSPCSCVLASGGASGGPTAGALGETSEVKDSSWAESLSLGLEIRWALTNRVKKFWHLDLHLVVLKGSCVFFPPGYSAGAPWEGVWGQSQHTGSAQNGPQNARRHGKIDPQNVNEWTVCHFGVM